MVSTEELDNAAAEVERELEQPLAENAPEGGKKPEKEVKEGDDPIDKEGKPKEKEPEKEIPDEPVDNAERSQLGRRVTSMEANMESFLEEFREYMKPKEGGEPEPEEEDFLGDDVDDFVSKQDLSKYLDQRDRKKEKEIVAQKKAQDTYNIKYNSVFAEMEKTAEPEFHKQVLDEMKENHNKIRSSDGLLDAEFNYLKAKNVVLERAATEKVNPLEKNKDKENTNLGGPSGTVIPGKEATPVKLDKFAQDFVNRTKMTGESVADALDGEPSPSLLGGQLT